MGATPLHLAAASLDAVPQPDATDLVASLAGPTASVLSHRSWAENSLLRVATATPLDVACVSPQPGRTALEALLAVGADVSGLAGARAFVLALVAGQRKRCRALLKLRVCADAPVHLSWHALQSQQPAHAEPPFAACPASGPGESPGVDDSSFALHAEHAATGATVQCSKLHNSGHHDERPVQQHHGCLHLTPVQWLLLASAGAVPCRHSRSQLTQLLQEALGCLHNPHRLGEMPQLPTGAVGAASTPCSDAFYLLR